MPPARRHIRLTFVASGESVVAEMLNDLFARIPGDWKYDWIEFAQACRRVRREGSQRLRLERVETVTTR